jgi:hypothetical protein
MTKLLTRLFKKRDHKRDYRVGPPSRDDFAPRFGGMLGGTSCASDFARRQVKAWDAPPAPESADPTDLPAA